MLVCDQSKLATAVEQPLDRLEPLFCGGGGHLAASMEGWIGNHQIVALSAHTLYIAEDGFGACCQSGRLKVLLCGSYGHGVVIDQGELRIRHALRVGEGKHAGACAQIEYAALFIRSQGLDQQFAAAIELAAREYARQIVNRLFFAVDAERPCAPRFIDGCACSGARLGQAHKCTVARAGDFIDFVELLGKAFMDALCAKLVVPDQEDFQRASINARSEEHTSELQSRGHLVCRLLLEKKNKKH